MNKKELCATGIGITATVIGTVIYLVKMKKKKDVMTELKENLKTVGREHWMKKKSLNARFEIIKWVRSNVKEELSKELDVIEKNHWMSKAYQNSFRSITDYLWNNVIIKEKERS